MRFKIEEKIIDIQMQGLGNISKKHTITSAYCMAQYLFGQRWGWNVYGVSYPDYQHITLATFSKYNDAEKICNEITDAIKKGDKFYLMPIKNYNKELEVVR